MSNEYKFSQVSKLVQAAFPGAKSRRPVRVEARDTYRVSNYWDGGSRDECVVLSVATGRPVSLEQAGFVLQTQNNPYRALIGDLKLSAEFIVVEHVIFCGKDRGYRIYVHSSLSDAQRLFGTL